VSWILFVFFTLFKGISCPLGVDVYSIHI